MDTPISVGGQAVLEGVMMRSPGHMTVAVRTPSGEIAMKRDRLKLLSDSIGMLKWPVVRGTVTLFSSLALGMKALNFSASCAIEEEEKAKGKDSGTWNDLLMGATMLFSLAAGLALFFYLPLQLTELLKDALPVTANSSVAFNLVDGVIRVLIFLAYVTAISRMKDIRRVFEYHGAEHKAIYAYESGAELTVENARKYPRLHPRCGTSFLLVVMALSIVVFSFIPKEAALYEKGLARLVLLPLVAGLSYEFIKYSAKKKDNRLISALVAPGLWLQGLTTLEPSDDQIEVAISALTEALKLEEMKEEVV